METEKAHDMKRIRKEFSRLFFSEAVTKIDSLVENLPLIQREQTRIYLYSLVFEEYRVNDVSKIPKSMLNFTSRIFPNISSMTPDQIEAQWNQFASAEYINLLQNVPALMKNFPWFISLLQLKPTFGAFSQALSDNIIPSFLVKYLPEFAWTIKDMRNPSSLPLC